ncbi:hypothetical protein AMATHDRAFT_60586 [Amanita thiersii Skay4041]|uniref:Copper acquisition factor BIM1-like domain-containing protein n=1 Tax=Amanita thiersii Skay4041 TaxID=703135 RepID=A0A2A9NN47_9AGAR|nr:hypothetical protein AMATHDRAFT_60586 [Amanita thiersii Skay4041]
MHVPTAVVLTSLIAAVNAHFQLQFPAPRGPFNEDKEPTFCDGFNNPTNNRTTFPLSGGFFSLNSEHPQWSTSIYLSTGNASSFDDFKQIKPFFLQKGEGAFCFPLDFTSPNATGLSDGQNVSIQIVFDGGDGSLYQCADLKLSATANLTTQMSQCSNATGSSTASGSGATPTSSSAGRTAWFGFSTVALGLAGLGVSIAF